MNNVTQVKRGSTASWSLGPELVHWEKLDVWGKDSLIHCEGTDLEMNVYTSSANYFYDENGSKETFKRPGLWLIQRNEIQTDPSKTYSIKLHTTGPSDCWIEIVDNNGLFQGSPASLSDSGEIEVSNLENFGLYIRWPEERPSTAVARIKLSIREVGTYEELAPGQLGVEYTENGQVKLKAGMPNTSKWNELPYIGGGDGGLDILFVTFDANQTTASHNSSQIYNHLQSGGHVIGRGPNHYFPLIDSDRYGANFVYTFFDAVTGEPYKEEFYEVDDSGKVKVHTRDPRAGAGVLLVTIDIDTMTASHSPLQMIERISLGGSVVLLFNDVIYVPIMYSNERVFFMITDPAENFVQLGVITVNEDKSVSVGTIGSSNLLLVTIDSNTMTASHSSTEIYDYFNSGGNIILQEGEALYALSACTSDMALFTIVFRDEGSIKIGVIVVNEDHSVSAEVLDSGNNVLLVTLLGSTLTASHSSTEIYEHFSKGGTVVLEVNGALYALSACKSDLALFTVTGPTEEGLEVGTLVVNEDRSISIETLDNSNNGNNVLFVAINTDTMTASHSPAEITAHIGNGGNVFASLNSGYLALSMSTDSQTTFSSADFKASGGVKGVTVTVKQDKSVSVAMSPEQGGPLVVTYDENDGKASNSATQIYWCVSAGGTVVFKRSPEELYALVRSTEDCATFAGVGNDGRMYIKMIGMGGTLEEYEYEIPTGTYLTEVNDRLNALETAAGDIDAALDDIISIQEELLTPSAEGVEF